MNIGVIIQARTSSTRLPEKVLKELPFKSGVTVLEQVIRRVKVAQKVNLIIIATTTDQKDQKIVEVAQKEGVLYYRGSKDNVLERYYLAAKENHLDLIIRITSDCPCIDPFLVDYMIERHINEKVDYTSNSLHRTFPHGLDIEILTFSALEKAYFEASKSFELEHVTYYIYKSKPEDFKILSVTASAELSDPEIRITLDTSQDYALLCAVYDFLYSGQSCFKHQDIIELFRTKPWLKMINSSVLQKKVFNSFEEEVQEALKLLSLQELHRVKQIVEKLA